MKPVIVAKYRKGMAQDDQDKLEKRLKEAAFEAGCVPLFVAEDVTVEMLSCDGATRRVGDKASKT